MIITTFRGIPFFKKSLSLIFQQCSCRRTMVNNIVIRKINRLWQHSKLDLPDPRVFTEPRCGDCVKPWYLYYRWIICLLWIALNICSLGEFGGEGQKNHIYTWPVYLTNWDLVLGATQSILGAILVTKRWSFQKTVNNFDTCNITYGKLEKLYWILFTITCSLAIGVTGSYWVLVYNPKIHHIDALNIMIHLCNSLLMVIDICIVKIPLKFQHYWWSSALMVFYFTFTIIYFLAGGLDKNGKHYIYKKLDWKTPGMSSLFALGGMMFLIIVHGLFCYLTILLNRICDKRAKYINESQSSSADEKKRKCKELEIV